MIKLKIKLIFFENQSGLTSHTYYSGHETRITTL
jgi:hypothetical protein